MDSHKKKVLGVDMMTCEECGSQMIRRIVGDNGVTLQCKECGWERDYPARKTFVKAPPMGFDEPLTKEQKEFFIPPGIEFIILEKKKRDVGPTRTCSGNP